MKIITSHKLWTWEKQNYLGIKTPGTYDGVILANPPSNSDLLLRTPN
jgi:hypothetical protein